MLLQAKSANGLANSPQHRKVRKEVVLSEDNDG